MGRKKTNLLGQHFGKWTVIAEAPSKHTTYGKTLAMWTCQCECGIIKEVAADDLRNGKSTQCKSCAASIFPKDPAKIKNNNKSNKDYSLYLPDHKKIKNLVGQQYPHFEIIQYYDTDKRGASRWLCKCECGNQFIAKNNEITSGKRVNCGCSRRSNGEIKIEDILKQNNINYQIEYKFTDLKDIRPLRFDFAIFDDNNNLIKLIEFQGEQHYQNNNYFINDPREHDKMKREYCKTHNIKLLEIPYSDYNKITIDYLLNN